MSDPTAWQDRAACRHHDPDLFYPASDGADGPFAEQIKAAKRVCRGCPVQELCFLDTLTVPAAHDHGIRAATTARERRAMRRRKGENRAAA